MYKVTAMPKFLIIRYSLPIIFLIALLPSCKEVGPNINLKNNQNAVSDTTYMETPVAAAELKNVVIEEFTGVRCPNCPQGHQIIQAIKAANGERVLSVSLHPLSSLTAVYPFSVDTFENGNAQTLFEYLVDIGLLPAAAIDRIPAATTSVLFDKNNWATKTTEELAKATPVNLKLSKTFNTTTRELTIVSELHYTKNVSTQNKLTLLLTESNIVTAQLNGSVKDTFYTHNDIERAFVSDIQGDVVTQQPLDAGRVVVKVYKTTLAPKWKPENMNILAYVHEFQNDSKIVHQARELKIIP